MVGELGSSNSLRHDPVETGPHRRQNRVKAMGGGHKNRATNAAPRSPAARATEGRRVDGQGKPAVQSKITEELNIRTDNQFVLNDTGSKRCA